MQPEIKKSQDPRRDFYYKNAYPDDAVKARYMQGNTHHDLEPFRSYIRASIGHIGVATSEGADVFVADTKTTKYLVGDFTLIKPHLQASYLSVKKPKNIYALTIVSDDIEGDFDVDTFEVYLRQEKVCSYKDKIDCYNGVVFVKVQQDFSGKKCNLYDNANHKDDSVKCLLKNVDFSDTGSYRFEGVSVNSVDVREDELIIHTNADISGINCIKIFGEDCPIVKKENFQSIQLTGKGVSVCPFYNELYAVSPAIKQKNFLILSNSRPIQYSICSLLDLPENTVQEVLQTKDVVVRNGRLLYNGDEEDSILLNGLNFRISSEKSRVSKRLRDKSGKCVGTIIEVVTNNKSIGELESNTDVFFKESVEQLTDVLPFQKGKNRSFRIGWRSENLNLIEIAEEKNNGLVRIDDLPSHLYAVPNDWQLKKQQYAINKLCQMPCIEHEGLLKLFERKESRNGREVRWEPVEPAKIQKWYILSDKTYDGCKEQRDFVEKALATGDFAFLDGPPGSGKTTVLLEIIAQLVVRGKKVLLTASTNAAIDNILERLHKLPQAILNKILAVRIGNEWTISEKVMGYSLSDVPDEYHEEIIQRANVVCGTIFGILKHPEFRLNEKNQPVRPLYDFLLIDEASKTTFQDFLIPALYSRHWILSGDLKQLTPYVEQETIRSSIEEIPEFDRNMQRIQTILCLAKDNRLIDKPLRFYIVVSTELALVAEELITDDSGIVGVITKKESKCPYSVSVPEIKNGKAKSIILYGAKLLLVDASVKEEVKKYIPSNFIPMFDVVYDDKYSDIFLKASVERYFSDKKPNIELGLFRDKTKFNSPQEISNYWIKALKEHSWAQEITWRLCRIQELFLDETSETVKKYKKQIEERMPSSPQKKEKVLEYCHALTGIALPSILQLLQKGLSKDVQTNHNITTLNSGFEDEDFKMRHTILTYQHRMHPDISAFSAKEIYHGEALKNGSEMNDNRNWDCPVFGKKHAVWLDSSKEILKDCINENFEEIRIIRNKIEKFMSWAKHNKNPYESSGNWSIACITYYKRQEQKLKREVKTLFNEQKEKNWYKSDEKHIEVLIYSVDKFQGREADIVFLSFVKAGQVPLGFMDSPNRLNVALTRARYQLVVVGSNSYFKKNKKSQLLKNLAGQLIIEEAR